MSHPWFAVNVRTRSEVQIAASLKQKSYMAFAPTYKECRQYSDRVKTVDSALFSGYIFCRLDPVRYLPVLTTPGVYSVVTVDGTPVPIEDSEIAAIERVVNSEASVRPWPFLKAGQKVQIKFGAFAGIEGVLLQEKGLERLVLSVSLLQRSISVELDRTWIQPS